MKAKVWDNYAESYNHVLKRLTDWKQLALPKLVSLILVSLIRDDVAAQYKDIEKALINVGPFQLTSPYEKFKLTFSQWYAKSATEREQLIKSFMKYATVSGSKTACTSTNQKLMTFLPSSACGKKPGQRKRKRAEKSHPKSKVPCKDSGRATTGVENL